MSQVCAAEKMRVEKIFSKDWTVLRVRHVEIGVNFLRKLRDGGRYMSQPIPSPKKRWDNMGKDTTVVLRREKRNSKSRL